MSDTQNKINHLHSKLNSLLKRQYEFSQEIKQIQFELSKLKKSPGMKDIAAKTSRSKIHKENRLQRTFHSFWNINIKTNFEKFIGENLISKIGIIITVLGVAIGAKYTIEHDLISPLMRILLGYLLGFILLGIGIRLKKKYHNYSAVLVSGAMAIMYFITYAAYTYYSLFPQLIAFSLMVLFTVITVYAALHYNKQLIAHIGLVGAYAVPLLLGESPGNAFILFSYVFIINLGILIIAFRKYWKMLYYSSFVFSWLIYLLWYSESYIAQDHFGLAWAFLILFFVGFYLMFLAYKLIRKEIFNIEDIILLLANSFIFYGIGYSILENSDPGENYLGLFTLANATIHFFVNLIVFQQKLVDKKLVYFVSGLALTFLTIAIPVQLDGSWVTLLWVVEAAVLFWIGKSKDAPLYENLSYPLMALAFFSLLQDWSVVYPDFDPQSYTSQITPFINGYFLSSTIFVIAFGFINYVFRKESYPSSLSSYKELSRIISYALPGILIFTLYFTFHHEISLYFDQLFRISAGLDGNNTIIGNKDLLSLGTVWKINYALLFFSLLSYINLSNIKNLNLAWINLVMNVLVLLIFLFLGLAVLGNLRESYLNQGITDQYQPGSYYVFIRYISFVFVILLLFTCHRYARQGILKRNMSMAFDCVFHITLLWLLSDELIHWMEIAGSSNTNKLGLSILWGVYALALIALGIWKDKKYLRIGAIALFAITLIKLFFYDISHLDTVSKTIVFISLGILLLIISFLYTKYRNVIFGDSNYV